MVGATTELDRAQLNCDVIRALCVNALPPVAPMTAKPNGVDGYDTVLKEISKPGVPAGYTLSVGSACVGGADGSFSGAVGCGAAVSTVKEVRRLTNALAGVPGDD